MGDSNTEPIVWGPGFEHLVAAMFGRPCPVPFQLHGPLVIGNEVYYIRNGALLTQQDADKAGIGDLELDGEAVRLSVIDGNLSEEYEGAEDLIRVWKHFDHILGHDVKIRLDFAIGSMYMLLSTSCVFARELDDDPQLGTPEYLIAKEVRRIVMESRFQSLRFGGCAGHMGACVERPRKRVEIANLVMLESMRAINATPEQIAAYVAKYVTSPLLVAVCSGCYTQLCRAGAYVASARREAQHARSSSMKLPSGVPVPASSVGRRATTSRVSRSRPQQMVSFDLGNPLKRLRRRQYGDAVRSAALQTSRSARLQKANRKK